MRTCKNPHCGRDYKTGPKCDGARGLCGRCYAEARRLVRSGKTTWRELEDLGMTEVPQRKRTLKPSVFETWLAEKKEVMTVSVVMSPVEHEIATLREALYPFAEYADRVDDSADGRNPIGDDCPAVKGGDGNAEPLPTLGDCRYAASVLACCVCGGVGEVDGKECWRCSGNQSFLVD